MDNFVNFKLFHILVNSVKDLNEIIPCTDSFLQSLVNSEIISENERYSIFSYPLPTVFFGTHRYLRLLEILRENKKLRELLVFLRSWRNTLSGSQKDRLSILLFVIRTHISIQQDLEPFFEDFFSS
jgi:hypothetical protein